MHNLGVVEEVMHDKLRATYPLSLGLLLRQAAILHNENSMSCGYVNRHINAVGSGGHHNILLFLK